MNKWLGPTANKITLGRLPCLVLVLIFVFWLGRDNLVHFWVGASALTIGMILDWLDGWWARNITKKPTSEGQFLDQIVDKLFVWPIWFSLSVVQFGELAWPWLGGSILLLCLDIKSCRKHWENYCRDLVTGFNREHGAVWQGKWKFFCQNVLMCVHVATLCPALGRNPAAWWEHGSEFIRDAGNSLRPYTGVALAVAIGLAGWSLVRRSVMAALDMKDED